MRGHELSRVQYMLTNQYAIHPAHVLGIESYCSNQLVGSHVDVICGDMHCAVI